MPKKHKKVSRRTVKKWFQWCLDQAYAERGAYTGGPYEEEFDRYLKNAERAYKSL